MAGGRLEAPLKLSPASVAMPAARGALPFFSLRGVTIMAYQAPRRARIATALVLGDAIQRLPNIPPSMVGNRLGTNG